MPVFTPILLITCLPWRVAVYYVGCIWLLGLTWLGLSEAYWWLNMGIFGWVFGNGKRAWDLFPLAPAFLFLEIGTGVVAPLMMFWFCLRCSIRRWKDTGTPVSNDDSLCADYAPPPLPAV